MKNLSIWILEVAELFFLKSHGWKFRLENKFIGWYPPGDYPFRRRDGITRGHAVNSQKQAIYNPMHGGARSEFN